MRAITIGTQLARAIFAIRGNNSEVHLNEAELAAACTLAAERATPAQPVDTDDSTVTITREEWNAAKQCADTLTELAWHATHNPYELAHGHDRDELLTSAQKTLDRWIAAHETADPHCTCSDCFPEDHTFETDAEAHVAAGVPDDDAEATEECAPDCASRVPFGECTCGRVDRATTRCEAETTINGRTLRCVDTQNHPGSHLADGYVWSTELEAGGPDERD